MLSRLTKFILSLEVLITFLPLALLWFFGVVFVVPMLIVDPNNDYVSLLVLCILILGGLFGFYALVTLYLKLILPTQLIVEKRLIRIGASFGFVSLIGFNLVTSFNAWMIYFLPQMIVALHMLYLGRKHVF